MQTELEQQAAEQARARVCFLGHIACRKELADLYANADVFVHPNPREPFGIAPLEAMASGLPLVAPASGGVAAYADASNCLLVRNDPAAFADGVRAIRGNAKSTSARVAAARETAARFGWHSVCSSFLDLYAEICAFTAGVREQPVLPPDFVSTHEHVSLERRFA